MPRTWKVDVTRLFEEAGIWVQKPVLASFNRATYEYDPNPKANWLYYAFLAFRILAEQIQKPELAVTVGAGSGLDGIAMYETLRPKKLKLIDINPRVIEVARSNLRDYFTKVGAMVEWEVVLGNLCASLKPETVDVAYANIPTIPGKPSRILAGMNSSSFYNSAWTANSPKLLAQNYLGLQYEFLREARVVLRYGRPAMIALGVRMSASIVDELFEAAGFGGYEPLVLDIKEQSQPKVVAASYAKQEHASGASFDFYKEGVQGPTASGLSLSAFKESIRSWRVSAQEALDLSNAGQKVYHVIAMLKATKVS